MHIAAMHDNKDDQNKDNHNKDDYDKDYHNETYNQLIELYMALITYGINHKMMTTSITKCRLSFQNLDYFKMKARQLYFDTKSPMVT